MAGIGMQAFFTLITLKQFFTMMWSMISAAKIEGQKRAKTLVEDEAMLLDPDGMPVRKQPPLDKLINATQPQPTASPLMRFVQANWFHILVIFIMVNVIVGLYLCLQGGGGDSINDDTASKITPKRRKKKKKRR